MIKKVAQSYQELHSFVKNILFNSNLNIRPGISERTKAAKEGVAEAKKILAEGKNPFSNIYLRIKVLGDIDEESFKESSKEKIEFQKLFGNLSLAGSLDAEYVSHSCEYILSQLESLYKEYDKVVDPQLGEISFSEEESLQQTKEVTFDEEKIFGGPWYVTSGSSFSPQTKFFGPFEKQMAATLFSILMHPEGVISERTVLSASQTLTALKSFDQKILDLSTAHNIKSESPVNANLVGMVELAAKEIDPNSPIQISTSGEVFEALTEYLEKNIALSNSGQNIDELKKVLTFSFIKKFIKNFFEIKSFISKNVTPVNSERLENIGNISAPPEFNKADVIVTPVEVRAPQKIKQEKKEDEDASAKSFNSRKIKLDIPEGGSPAPREAVEAFSNLNFSSISVVNPDNPELLSDQFILNFILEMRQKSSGLANLRKDFVENSLSNSFNLFKNFFKDCLDKDKEIKKEIISFREKNQLIINQAWTPSRSAEWEFQNKFSITKRIIQDPIVSSNLKEFFLKIVESWFFGKDEKALKKIIKKTRSLNDRYELKLDENSLVDAHYKVLGDLVKEINQISKVILEEKINDIISSSNLEMYDTSSLLDDIIINDIKMSSYIHNRVHKTLQPEENIIEQQSFYTINCGVCGQATQVPSQYKDDLISFSNSESQYSFFREDGSFISDSEIQSRSYNITDDLKETIRSIIEKGARRLFSEKILNEEISLIIRKNYSWQDINSGIYNSRDYSIFSDAISKSSEIQILTNTIFQIIRNDVLKQLGATPAGARGIFGNKTLCAASLVRMTESFKQDKRILENLEKKMDYSCLAKINASYNPVESKIPEYYSSAYTAFSGPKTMTREANSGFGVGYRFSRNFANCPCHIDSSSSIAEHIKKNKKVEDFIGLIAVPNIPENIADLLSKNENFGASKQDIYYSPTSPDGSSASRYEEGDQNLSSLGYLICGKNVSISMFDKDPSSPNYIRKVLENILLESGINSFTSAIKILIDYGIEINDIKPYVENILESQGKNKTASFDSRLSSSSFRRKFLNNLFKNVKVSIGQDLSSSLSLIKKIGLICESGHKFTLEQSWNFAKTHSAVFTSGNRFKKIKNAMLLSFLNGNPDSTFKIMASTNSNSGIGLLRVNFSEDELRSSGFLTPAEIQSFSELKNFIETKKLYFKSDDGSVYIFDNPVLGMFKERPWDYEKLSFNSRTDLKINRYSSGKESTTTQSEGGGSTVRDIADTSSLSGYDSQVSSGYGQSTQTGRLDERLSIVNIIYPGILENDLRSLVQTPIQSSREKMDYLNEQSGIFIDKFIKILKMSRVWGKMAADSQIDFLAQFNRTPEIRPTLTSDIENILNSVAADLNIDKSKLSEIYLRFFEAYDFNGLIERNISYNQFLSLAGIAQYYRGFETPFISNMPEKAAKGLIVDAIYSALKNNINYIFDIDRTTLDSSGILNLENFENKIRSLATSLFSPYSSYPIEFIKENAVINYTGRAIIFSYAIDIVNSIRSFFNKHFLNKTSSLYIGPTNPADDGIFRLIEELLQSFDSNGVYTPKILVMEEGEFEAKISNLKAGLIKIYQPDNTFASYLRMMSISYNRDDSNTENIYKGIVFSRFGKCLQMASSSLDYLISDLIAKPLGTKDTKLAAESLDSSIDFLVRQRDPINYDKNKLILSQTRVLFGEPTDVFQRNAIQYGRLSLDSSSVSLEDKGDEYPAPMIYKLSLTCLTIPPEKLSNGINYTYKSGNMNVPYLIILGRVYLSDKNKSQESSNLVYICLVPKDIQVRKKSTKDNASEVNFENIDLMDLIPPEFVRLNNTQGIEFASRYISNLSEVDTSRLVLVSSNLKYYNTFPSSTVDSAIKKNTFIENVFEIRVQKIDESPSLWPPPNNLFINNLDIARGPDDNPDNIMLHLRQGFSGDRTQHIERYYKNIFGNNEKEFLDNLEKFNTSYSSKSIAPMFSHGIVLPIGGDSKNISFATNITVREDSNEEKVGMTISESKVYIPRSEKESLNISWMFATNDPQFKDESGQLRIKLIQSGIVQKLDYIRSKVAELYSWFSSKEVKQIIESIDEEGGGFGVSFDSQDLFIDTILSEDSVFVQREISPSYGLVSVSPYSNSIINSYPESDIGSSEFLFKFGLLCDFFNSAQRLNKLYEQQKPILSSVSAINLAKKQASPKKKEEKQSAFCIKMLDPYTLWMMINNPIMQSNFGGPINPEDIDDYKNFIISTFGLERLKDQVLEATGFDESEFKVNDLFNLIEFYNKNLPISKNQEKLLKFSKLFKFNIDDSGQVASYRFGIPASKEFSSSLLKMMNSLEFSEYAVDPNSYLEYPVMLRSSLDDIGETEIKKIVADAEKKVQGMISEIKKEVQAKTEGMPKEVVEEEIRREIMRVKTELIVNHPDLLELRRKMASLSTGEKVLSIQDIISFATKKTSIERPRLLAQEGLRIVRDLWSSPTKKISKNISWRKIAQSATDDDGTIVRSLYHRWWAAYLDILAKTQN